MKSNFSTKIIQKVLENTPFSNSDIVNINEGVSTDVYRLNLNNNTYYLRVLFENEISDFQCYAHRILLEKNVKVPKVLHSQNNVKDLHNKSYMIVESINGESLKEYIIKLNGKSVYKILKEAGKDLAKINSVKTNGFGWFTKIDQNILIGEYTNPSDFLFEKLTKSLNSLVKDNVITEDYKKRINDYLSKKKDILKIIGKDSFLSHGDFGSSHIYQRDGIYTGIIDFGNIKGTPKYWDLSYIYSFNRDIFEGILDGYKEVIVLDNDYKDIIDYLSIIICINKIYWVNVNRPHKLSNHKGFKTISEILHK